MGFEPAPGEVVRDDAGSQQGEADGYGAEDPFELHAALEHEAVEQGQHEDEHGCFGKERRTAMRGDRDEFYECGGGRLGVDGATETTATGGD